MTQPIADPPIETVQEPASEMEAIVAGPEPSFRQSLTAGVNRLATALDDLNIVMGRKEQASGAVDDARQQVVTAQANMQGVSMAVDDARAAAVDAFDILADTLAAGRASVVGWPSNALA